MAGNKSGEKVGNAESRQVWITLSPISGTPAQVFADACSFCRNVRPQSRARIDGLLFSAPRTAPQTASIHLLFLRAFFRPPLWVRRGAAML